MIDHDHRRGRTGSQGDCGRFSETPQEIVDLEATVRKLARKPPSARLYTEKDKLARQIKVSEAKSKIMEQLSEHEQAIASGPLKAVEKDVVRRDILNTGQPYRRS